MEEYEFCSKNKDPTCFTNLPFLAVMSHWVRENRYIFLDFDPAFIMFFAVFCLITWILIYTSMWKIFILFGGMVVFAYTDKYDYSEDPIDYTLNIISNTCMMIAKIVNTVIRTFFGEHLVL